MLGRRWIPVVYLLLLLRGISPHVSAQVKTDSAFEWKTLIEQLGSPDAAVQLTAALSLLESGPVAKEAYPALAQTLMDDDMLDVAVAARAIYAEPREVVQAHQHVAALQLGTKARVAAAWELSRIGPAAASEVTGPLLTALAHPDKHERNFIVLALAMSGERTPEVRRALEAIANDAGPQDSPQTDYKYPRALAQVALELGNNSASPAVSGRISDLANTLSTQPGRVCPRVVAGLRELGRFATTSKPTSAKATRRGSPAVHESIALAMGYLDSLSNAPKPEQIAREEQSGKLSDESRLYIMALGGVQQGIAAVVKRAWMEAQQDERVIAVRHLATLDPSANDVNRALKHALADPDWIVRREAFFALDRLSAAERFGKAVLRP